jgi:two-component system, NtrC family, sensor histidine kinase HydH
VNPYALGSELYLISAVGSLFLAALVSLRARHARGAIPLTLLNLALFLWELSESLRLSEAGTAWISFINTLVTLFLPLLLLFVVEFCQVRVSKVARLVAGSVLGLFTLVTAASWFSARALAFIEGPYWNFVFICLAVVSLGWEAWAILRSRRAQQDPGERRAMTLVLVGVVSGLVLGLTEPLPGLGLEVPKLGCLGTLVFSTVVSVTVLRHQFAEAGLPIVRVLVLLAAATLAVALNVLLIARWAPEQGFAILSGVGLTFALVALYRLLALRWFEAAARQRHLAAIGTMAAGVAHEIKNPLTSIKGAAQLLQHDLKQQADAAAPSLGYLELVISEVDRLNAVVEEFLAFARPPRPRLQPVQLNALLEGVLTLQRTALGPQIVVQPTLAPALPSISADPDLLKQALVNILKNAVEAVGAAGTVGVTTRALRRGRRPGVAIEIDDSGPGLSPEHLAHLFEPFHTSKPKGSGLGLAITRRLLEAHGGTITIGNRAPAGARVVLWLPEVPPH